MLTIRVCRKRASESSYLSAARINPYDTTEPPDSEDYLYYSGESPPAILQNPTCFHRNASFIYVRLSKFGDDQLHK